MKKKEKTLIQSFEFLYNRLQDTYSKKILIQVLTYRLLGHRKVKLPMNNGHYLENIQKIENKIENKEDHIKTTNTRDPNLYLHDLRDYGFSAKMYNSSLGIYHCFVHSEYEYKPVGIHVQKNDVVIDAGACYGDTALYFAEYVENKGKVYSFEFSPKNLEVLHKNLSLNTTYQNIIEVIERPVWSTTGISVSETDNGPGNRVVFSNQNASNEHLTISLDDFAKEKQLTSVDFIKMDIEGSELEALKGAEKVLRQFKPTLAVCVYHKITDCYDIPAYLESLNLGYKFYFDHFSVHHEESVLFARVEN